MHSQDPFTPQNRHPERSSSRTCDERSRRTPMQLTSPKSFAPFRHEAGCPIFATVPSSLRWASSEARPSSLRRHSISIATITLATLLSGCMVGPKYTKPTGPSRSRLQGDADQHPLQGRELQSAQPADTALKGDWWTIFNDPQLNDLEATGNRQQSDPQSRRRSPGRGPLADPLQPFLPLSNHRRSSLGSRRTRIKRPPVLHASSQ